MCAVTLVTCECVCVALVAIAGRRYIHIPCVLFVSLTYTLYHFAAELEFPVPGPLVLQLAEVPASPLQGLHLGE